MILEQLLAEIAAAQQELACLSRREREVLTLLAKGFCLKEIGALLGVTRETASNHNHRIHQRLGLTTAGAAALAAKARWA